MKHTPLIQGWTWWAKLMSFDSVSYWDAFIPFSVVGEFSILYLKERCMTYPTTWNYSGIMLLSKYNNNHIASSETNENLSWITRILFPAFLISGNVVNIDIFVLLNFSCIVPSKTFSRCEFVALMPVNSICSIIIIIFIYIELWRIYCPAQNMQKYVIRKNV